MPEVPTTDELKKLSNERGEYHVSLYMPTIKGGMESQQNSKRLKNLLREAERKLHALNGGSSAGKLFSKAQALAEDMEVFQHPGDGFALLISPSGELQYFHVPLKLDEDVHVNSRFHLKPLMQMHVANGQFYMLAISQKHLRLLKGNRFELNEIPLPEGTPKSLEEAMQYEDWERAHHFSPSGQGRAAGGAMQITSHGVDASDKENTKTEMREFLHMVNKGIMQILGKESAPLIIGGLEYVHSIAKDAISYPHLHKDGGVVRNVDDLRLPELHTLAWAVVEPLFHKAQDTALNRYNELKNKGLASCNLGEVLPAAADGRVETLLVPVNQHCWGTFDEESHKVHLQADEKSAGGEDLLDLAAMQALLNGGAVYAVKQEEMPDNATVAAVFRY